MLLLNYRVFFFFLVVMRFKTRWIFFLTVLKAPKSLKAFCCLFLCNLVCFMTLWKENFYASTFCLSYACQFKRVKSSAYVFYEIRLELVFSITDKSYSSIVEYVTLYRLTYIMSNLVFLHVSGHQCFIYVIIYLVKKWFWITYFRFLYLIKMESPAFSAGK